MAAISQRAESSTVVADAAAALSIDASFDDIRLRLRVSVRGELDMATAPALTDLLSHAFGCSVIELDVSGLTFCDVAGLAAIQHAQDAMTARGCRFVVFGGAPLRLLLSMPALFPRLSVAADGFS